VTYKVGTVLFHNDYRSKQKKKGTARFENDSCSNYTLKYLGSVWHFSLSHDRVKSFEICLVWKTESSCSRCKDDIIKHFLHV
jgi:hypothetical protein